MDGLRNAVRAIVDHLIARGVLLGFALVLFLVATHDNLQIRAFFTESAGTVDRLAATIGAALTALAHFAIRRDTPLRHAERVDLGLHLLPPAIIGFLPPWGGGNWLAPAVVLAVELVVLLAIARRTEHVRQAATDRLLGMVIGVFIVCYALFSVFRVDLPRDLGAVALVALFLGLLSVLIDLLTRRRRLFVAVLAAIGLSLGTHELQHEAQYRPMQPDAGAEYAGADPFALWLFDRPDAAYYRENDLPYPVFLVASEGGGGYAMAHAFSFLSKMGARCPNFGQHLFALVGVSGGQIGNTLYHANMDVPQTDRVSACGDSAPVSHSAYLSTDHLSPLLAHLLFVEIPRKLLFLGSAEPGRSHVLLESFNKTSDSYAPVPDVAYDEHFWRFAPDHDMFAYRLSGKPALVSVTVNVQTGNRFVFSPFRFTTRGESYVDLFQGSGDLEEAGQKLVAPSLGSAALASASFPWVTPSLRFSWERAFNEYLDNPPDTSEEDYRTDGPPQSGSVNLVDGGYFENTGAETVSEILASIGREDNTVMLQRDGINQGDGLHWYGVDSDYAHRAFPDVGDCEFLEGRPLQSLHDNAVWTPCEMPYFLITVLVRNSAPEPASGGPQSFLTDPIKTLLQSRGARGGLAIATLEERRCGFFEGSACAAQLDAVGSGDPNPQIYAGIFQSRVDSAAMALPLGWAMPQHRMQAIENVVVPEEEVCARFLNDFGELDFTTPYSDAAPYPPELDLLVKRNCAHLRQMALFFDADALREALAWRP